MRFHLLQEIDVPPKEHRNKALICHNHRGGSPTILVRLGNIDFPVVSIHAHNWAIHLFDDMSVRHGKIPSKSFCYHSIPNGPETRYLPPSYPLVLLIWWDRCRQRTARTHLRFSCRFSS